MSSSESKDATESSESGKSTDSSYMSFRSAGELRSSGREITPAKILIIDDELINILFLTQALQKLNHASDYETDGEAAINRVAARITSVKMGKSSDYSLVLIDYNMPQMMGTEVAIEIYKLYKEAQLEAPKIYCCTSEEGEDFDRAIRESGMLGSLQKPI